jgi:hypothetical protein
MRRYVLVALAATSLPALAQAQQQGLQLAGGVVLLTKAGKLTVGSQSIESDTGHAVRGRLWYGLGAVSIGGEVQSSSQKYGADVSGVAPWRLNATYVGAAGSVHPVSLLGIMPYADVGIGLLNFSDSTVDEGSGPVATLGLGAQLGLAPHLALDLNLRLMSKSFRAAGLSQQMKYNPKLFAVMLTLNL